MKSLNVMLTCKYPFHASRTATDISEPSSPLLQDGLQNSSNATHHVANTTANNTASTPNSPQVSSRSTTKSYGVIAKIIDFGTSCVCEENGKVPETEGRLKV
jgi:hypothetical protein